MNEINKQRFLPELGKLLTFMVEEDRQTALAMYSKLFDDAEDEQKLMDLLVSPTRQAVVIARTYDARVRKQQLESPDAQEQDETPAFMLAIDELYQQVAPQHADETWEQPEEEPETPALVNQFSLFQDDAHPIDDSEYVPFQIEAEAVPIEEPVEQLPVEAPAEEPAEESVIEAEPAAEEPEVPEEEPAEEPVRELIPEEEPQPRVEEVPEAEPAVQEPVAPVFEEPVYPAPEPAPAPEPLDLDYIPATRRKAKVFLLILYVLFAIPVTLAGVVLLLIPTVLALALAVGVIAAGSFLFMSAFSGFPKLADILIVLGTAIIILAVGLLLLWLFVWFIGGAIGGLIRGVIELGRKWCYEEVPV